MKKFLSLFLAASMLISGVNLNYVSASDNTTVSSSKPRKMEYLTRGAIGATVDGNVYLSWRLLGTEPMDTVFNIYCNNDLIAENVDKTNFTHIAGDANNKYQIAAVINGKEKSRSQYVTILEGHKDKNTSAKFKSPAYAYIDVPINCPPDGTVDGKKYTYKENRRLEGKDDSTYTGGANDASVGDVDGDGEYEIILKWDPSNSKDNAGSGKTGNVYIDCYKLDGTQLWRIDLGRNIRAGSHYTQYIVYDFDGDGKAEIALKTAPGTIDGAGKYVTEVGNTDKIKAEDNSKIYVGSDGRVLSGPEYLTIFNGETGKAMQTIDYKPQRGELSSWGDTTGNRVDRLLAGVAYFDGVNPSLIMARGYYKRSAVTVYDWDGTNLTEKWAYDTGTNSNDGFFGQGNHQLSVADLDNDGFDELVYGSAALDHDGKLLHSMKSSLNSKKWGHGDALHVSDFNNDGKQEIFSVLEDAPNYGTGFRKGDGTEIWKKVDTTDTGRGVMANISKKYGALGWSTQGMFDLSGNQIDLNGTSNCTPNFAVYWDGDLLRELEEGDKVIKWDDDTNSFERLWTISASNPIGTNNATKKNPCLQADLFGDWREEIMLRHADNSALRIFISLEPTDYKLTTFMHDSQYRCAVAWQNVGYNQPPHPSYYIGPDKTKYEQPNIELIYSSGVNFEVNSINGIVDNAEIYIDGDLFGTTDSDGKAFFAAPYGEYQYQIKCDGYVTAEGKFTIDKQNKSPNVYKRLETKADSNAIITFKTEDKTVLKPDETISGLNIGESFALSDEYKEDITIDDKVYEYNPNLSISQYDKVGNDVNFNLVFSEKTIPDKFGNEIYRTNFSKDGYMPDSKTHGYTIKSGNPVYGNDSQSNTKYAAYDIGDNDITINLDKGYTNFNIEFDMAYNSADNVAGGSVFGLTAHNGNKEGSSMGIRFNGSLAAQFGSFWGGGKFNNGAALETGKMYHYVLECDGTNFYLTVGDKKTGAIVQNKLTVGLRNNVGTESTPVNKLVFKLSAGSGSGNVNISLGDFKVYQKGGPNDIKWKAEENNFVKIPSTMDYSPEYIRFQTGINDLYYDMSDGLTYCLQDSNGNEITPNNISIDKTTGQLTVSEGADLGAYYVVLKYGDNEIRKVKSVLGYNALTVNYKDEQGNELKKDIISLPAQIPENFAIADEYKEDITYNGVIYEYNADLSDNTNFSLENADSVNLVYKKKIVPGIFDKDVYNTNFSENGYKADSTKHGYTTSLTPEYNVNSDGVKYADYNIGDESITINLPEGLTNFTTEFDMAYNSAKNVTGGAVFGLTAHNGNKEGSSMGIRFNGSLAAQFGASWGGGKFANGSSLEIGKMYHYILECDGTNFYLTVGDKKTGTIIQNKLTVGLRNSVGMESAPVNKLVFKLSAGSGSGNVNISLSDLKVYQINGPTMEKWSTGKDINVKIPSETNIAPIQLIHNSGLTDYSIDLKSNLTYEVFDSEGVELESSSNISVNETGKLLISEQAAEGDYRLDYIYNGNVIRSINFNVAKSKVKLSFKSSGGISLKPDVIIENADLGSTVKIADSYKEDITRNKIQYEYSSDLSDDTEFVVDGERDVKLVFVEKKVFDKEIYKTNFSKDGFSADSDKNGYVTSIVPTYGVDTNGCKYGVYGIGDDKTVEVRLNETNKNFIAEYDMTVEKADLGFFGLSFLADNEEGASVGYLIDEDGINFAVSSNGEISKGQKVSEGTTIHFIVSFTDGKCSFTAVDRNTCKILQDKMNVELFDGLNSDKLINKLVVKRISGTGNADLKLGEFRVFQSTNIVKQQWSFNENDIDLKLGSKTDFSPKAYSVNAWLDRCYVDLTDFITYELKNQNGTNADTKSVILTDDGIISVSDDAEDGNYKLECSYNGQIVKSYNIKIAKNAMAAVYNSENDTDGTLFTYNQNTGAELKYNNGIWNFIQNSSDGGREFIGEFPDTNSGKAELKFKFSTGGTKDSNNAWNWSGREYEYEIQFLDADYKDTNPKEHMLLAICQQYTSQSVQEAQYYTKNIQKSQIKNDSNYIVVDNDPNHKADNTKRSTTDWYVTVNFDFDSNKLDFSLLNEYGNGYSYKNIDIGESFKTLKIVSNGNGAIQWSPKVSEVIYSKTAYAPSQVNADSISVENGDKVDSLNFDEPFNGGMPITSYKVVLTDNNDNSKVYTVYSKTKPISLNNVPTGKYTVKIFASNIVGFGAYTQAGPFDITNNLPVIIDISNTSVNEDKLTFDGTIILNSDIKDGVVIASLYNSDNILLDSKNKELDGSEKINISDFELQTKGNKNTILKIFIWNSVDGMKPVFELIPFEMNIK